MTVRATQRRAHAAGDAQEGPSAGAAPGGAVRRRARFPRAHRVPAVAFSPDWSDLAAALPNRGGEAVPQGVYAFGTGRAGLRFALERLAEATPQRRQVVVPAYCCYSVAAAVEHAGLELVVCDIDPTTLDYEPSALARVVGADTLCIVLAHLFGCGVDTAQAGALARSVGCYVIEDAAQAANPLAAIEAEASDDVTLRLVSSGRGKPVSTGGGGMVALQDETLRAHFDAAYDALPARSGRADTAAQVARAAVLKLLVHPRVFWVPAALPGLGIGETVYPDAIDPARMGAFQQRLYARQRTRFARERRVRQRHAAAYGDFLRMHATVPQVRALERADYAPHRLPVYLARDLADLGPVLARARRGGIAPMYPACLPELERVKRFCVNADTAVPGAAWTARHLVTLPTHAHVDARSRQRVLNALLELGV